MLRRAFTLIELLVVIGIMGLMVTVGIVGIRAGKSRSQLAGATRDVLALIRQARSIALITQNPAVITYSNETVDDENNVKVEVKSEKLFDDTSTGKREVRTLSGELVGESAKGENAKGIEKDAATETAGEGGESLNDVLNPHLALEITKGLKIKVEKGEDTSIAASSDGKVYKSAISVFSTTDYVSSKYNDKAKEKSKDEEKNSASSSTSVSDTMTEPVSVVWQTNGRTEPHTVWIYPEGSTPDKGLSIEVDKFGDCQVSQWAEDKR